jgi:hypothetical protein
MGVIMHCFKIYYTFIHHACHFHRQVYCSFSSRLACGQNNAFWCLLWASQIGTQFCVDGKVLCHQGKQVYYMIKWRDILSCGVHGVCKFILYGFSLIEFHVIFCEQNFIIGQN